MSFPYKTLSTNTDTLNSASYYTQSDLDNISARTVQDEYFGSSEQDKIEFSVYDIDGNLLNWNYIPSNPVYNVIVKTSVDVDQNVISYDYRQYTSGFLLSYDNKILLDVMEDLRSVGIVSGNNVVSYNFIRDMAGNSGSGLIIRDISPSRKEISLVPSFDGDNKLLSLEFNAFATNKVVTKSIVPKVITKLKEYQIYDKISELESRYDKTFDILRSEFGFKTNLEVVNFINEIYIGTSKSISINDNQVVNEKYIGIIGYVSDFIYRTSMSVKSKSELDLEIRKIVYKATENRLLTRNSTFKGMKNRSKIVNDTCDVFFTPFFENLTLQIYTEYNKIFLGYLQNAINFGSNNLYPILTHTSETVNGKLVLTVKLVDYLPDSIGLGDICWVSNISISPILQKVVIESPVVKKRYRISGPNFDAKISNYTSAPVNLKSSEDLRLTDEDSANISFYKKLNELNVDYTEFENFIIFSSAELRSKLYLNKAVEINRLTGLIDLYTSASIGVDNSISMSYTSDVIRYTSDRNSVYDSFDGYESYLNQIHYMRSGSMDNPSVLEYISGAIEYDINNKDSLVNNTPSYIVSDESNSDYLVFSSMVGHHYDNLYLYINKFPILQAGDTNTSSSYIQSLTNTLLEHFGWNPESSFDGNEISPMYLSGSNVMSADEKLKTIWSRILENLPILYKTKGTSESIRLLANIYGIPSYLLQVKEFGGNNMTVENNSSYTFEHKYYFTKFYGGTEHLLLPCTGSLSTLEFKFKVDPDINYPQFTPIELVSDISDNWAVTISKNYNQYSGDITLDVLDKELIIEDLPLFNGKIYSVMIKTETDLSGFDSGSAPTKVGMRIVSVDGDRIIFDGSSSFISDRSYSNVINSGSVICVGNYTSGNGFYGNIDKINQWNIELSDESFIDHAKNFNAYNTYNTSGSYDALTFQYSYVYPINLFTASASGVPVVNANKYYTSTGSARNFSNTFIDTVDCLPQSASVYPFQFSEIETTQNIKLNYAGPNRYKNLKINKVTETVNSRLMPNERSSRSDTITTDSNLVGVYISPFKVRDDDMINFLGNFNLMEEIGDPENIFSGKYTSLERLRNEYNKSNMAEVVLYQEFLTLYKSYFDGSFFSTVKQLLPGRAKIIDGIIIEPSILERNKYCNKQITASVSNLSTTIFSKDYVLSGSMIDVMSISINTGTGEVLSYRNNNYKSSVISDQSKVIRNSIFLVRGNYVDFDNTGSLVNYNVYKIPTSYVIGDDVSSITASFVEYNLIPSATTPEFIYDRDYTSYPMGHLSTKPNHMSRNSIKNLYYNSITPNSSSFIKSSQTKFTTIDANGLLDGSFPIESTRIKREISEISLVTA